MIHPTATKIGNAFRDQVATLLRTRYDVVNVEQSINGKNVDIVYFEPRLGRNETVAVECKDYAGALSATEFSRQIQADYRDLLESRSVDVVLIITSQEVSSAARARVNADPRFRLLSLAALEEHILGITNYVKGLSLLAQTEGLSEYYVPTRFEGSSTPAIEELEKWVELQTDPTLAVLGGYGQGKTSLATTLATRQATRYLADPRKRIPVLIRLGAVTHETTLEALFGREFTGAVRSSYNFATFMHLNNAGRLLVILDGFDEMQHGMRASDFRANFSEFSRLATERAKVLLTGRPSAFLSDTIKDEVLSGVVPIGRFLSSTTRLTYWPQRTLSLFSGPEVRAFFQSYMQYLISTRRQQYAEMLRAAELEQRIIAVLDQLDAGLYSRPVHAKLVAELAINPKFSFTNFTEYDLYSRFLTNLLERDAESKRARRLIAVEDRMKFQQRLAHWAWTRKFEVQGVFLKSDLPVSLLEGLADGGTEDSDSKMMEYIVSTVTDEKQGGRLGFSHRSFQEFLVAEHLRQLDCSSPSFDVSQVSAALDDAVLAFLRECQDQTHVWQWYKNISAARQPVSESLLYLMLSEPSVCADLDRRLRWAVDGYGADEVELESSEVLLAGIAAVHLAGDVRGNYLQSLLNALILFDSPKRSGPALFFRCANETDSVALLQIIVDVLTLRPLRLQVAARKSAPGSYYADDSLFRIVKASLMEESLPEYDEQRQRISPPPVSIIVDLESIVRGSFQRFLRPLVEQGPIIRSMLERSYGVLRIEESSLKLIGGDIQFVEVRDIYMDKVSPFGRKGRLNTKRLAQADSVKRAPQQSAI